MAGLTPTINLSGKTGDILKLKRYGMFAEVGIGCDFYLPFFKLRPELKFMYGLGNSIDKNHAKEMRDKNLKVYTNALKEAHTKMIVLSFYFEYSAQSQSTRFLSCKIKPRVLQIKLLNFGRIVHNIK